MARKVQVRVVDDLDGSEASETVSFSLDGTVYEIDLSSENAGKLRKDFAQYIENARRGGGRRRRPRTGPARERSSEIREWARQHGHKVSERGRIPATLIQEYESTQAGYRGKITALAANEMVIDVYLDTDDEVIASEVFAAINELAQVVGIEELAPREVRYGSIFRRFKATFQTSLSEESVQQRLQTLERLLELWQVDPRQAEVDQRTSDALSRVIISLENVPRACVRFGSILIVKYQDAAGSVLLSRQLSQPEILAFEKYPELQNRPETILKTLALAVSDQAGLAGDAIQEET
jgi:hypothetical protein